MIDIKWHKLKGFPTILDTGVADSDMTGGLFGNTYSFIVQERFGASISDIFDFNESYLKQMDIMKLGIALIKNIQQLHGIGYLHLDLKPDNILMSANITDLK